MALTGRGHHRTAAGILAASLVLIAACGGGGTEPSGKQGPPAGSSLTASIDGTSFVSIATIAIHTPPLAGLPNGTVGVTGTNKFTLPYTMLTFAVPGAVGTYSLGGGTPVPQNAAVTDLVTTTTGAQWNAGGTAGGSGSITLNTLTATGASGTFSFTLVPQSGSGAANNKVVTNGVFNVTF